MSMSAVTYPHIELGEDRIARVEGTRIKVVMLVEAHLAKGGGAEEIRQYYPMLSIAQIYGALTYYYDNKADIDAQIEHRGSVKHDMDLLFADSPASQRLAALKKKTRGGDQ